MPPAAVGPVSVVCVRLSRRVRCGATVTVVDLRRRKSEQAEREYEKVKHQLENLEESVRDRCKKEFTGTVGRTRPAATQRTRQRPL